MKVTLLFPRGDLDHDLLYRPFPIIQAFKLIAQPFLARSLRGQTSNVIAPLGLLKLAAVTPPEVEVKIIDERFDMTSISEDADLYGITVVTKVATRAYKLAKQLRAGGAKVVLGGPHVTFMPEEALKYADAVALGEGEYIWPQIVEDAYRNQLQPIYRADMPTAPRDIPLARFDMINPRQYAPVHLLEITRGCPHNCAFCSIKSMWGRNFRKRSITSIVDELSAQRSRFVYFASDNVSSDMKYAKELFRAIQPLGIQWAGFCTVNAAADTSFVELAAASGCKLLSVGFDSLSAEVLSEIHKESTNALSDYSAAIRNLHEHGILVFGNFLLGLDHDRCSILHDIVQFIEENCIECPNINIIIPYPGTELYERFQSEGRILHQDWAYYDTGASYVVFQPAHMTPNELRECHLSILGRIFSYSSILRRLGYVRSPVQATVALQHNLGMRYIYQHNRQEHIDPETQRLR